MGECASACAGADDDDVVVLTVGHERSFRNLVLLEHIPANESVSGFLLIPMHPALQKCGRASSRVDEHASALTPETLVKIP